jgi:hypothetical protein
MDGHLCPLGKNIVLAALMKEVTPVGFPLAGYKFSNVGNYIFAVKVTFLCHCSIVLSRCRVTDGGIKKYNALFMCGIPIIRPTSQLRSERIGSVLLGSKLKRERQM